MGFGRVLDDVISYRSFSVFERVSCCEIYMTSPAEKQVENLKTVDGCCESVSLSMNEVMTVGGRSMGELASVINKQSVRQMIMAKFRVTKNQKTTFSTNILVIPLLSQDKDKD